MTFNSSRQSPSMARQARVEARWKRIFIRKGSDAVCFIRSYLPPRRKAARYSRTALLCSVRVLEKVCPLSRPVATK